MAHLLLCHSSPAQSARLSRKAVAVPIGLRFHQCSYRTAQMGSKHRAGRDVASGVWETRLTAVRDVVHLQGLSCRPVLPCRSAKSGANVTIDVPVPSTTEKDKEKDRKPTGPQKDNEDEESEMTMTVNADPVAISVVEAQLTVSKAAYSLRQMLMSQQHCIPVYQVDSPQGRPSQLVPTEAGADVSAVLAPLRAQMTAHKVDSLEFRLGAVKTRTLSRVPVYHVESFAVGCSRVYAGSLCDGDCWGCRRAC